MTLYCKHWFNHAVITVGLEQPEQQPGFSEVQGKKHSHGFIWDCCHEGQLMWCCLVPSGSPLLSLFYVYREGAIQEMNY